MPAQKQDILSPWEKLRNGFSSACRGSGQVQSQHNCVLPYCLGRTSFTSSLECLKNPNHRREGMWGRTCSFWFPEILSLHIQLLLRTSGYKPGLACRGPAEVGMFLDSLGRATIGGALGRVRNGDMVGCSSFVAEIIMHMAHGNPVLHVPGFTQCSG